MNMKLYALLMLALMQSPVFAMEEHPAARVHKLRQEWNDAYNRYDRAVNQDFKYFFLGFLLIQCCLKSKE